MITYIKWFFIAVLCCLAAYLALIAIAALFVDPKKKYLKQSRFYRFLLNSVTAIALKVIRVRVHITGKDKLPSDQKILFVGNHVSNFDPIVTWYAFREWDIGFISKPENFNVPVFGRIIRKCCFMAIDRENPRKAMTTVNNAAKLLSEQEVSVGVYPEGTRSKSGELLPFHSGVFKIAQKANAPIAVIYVKGTEKIHKNYLRRTTDVYLDVLEVIPKETVKEKGTHIVSDETEQMLNREINKHSTKESLAL